MIPVTGQPWQGDIWPRLLREAVRSSHELLDRLNLARLPHLQQPDFPVRVPEPYWRRMRPGDPQDPLLRQVLARPEENLDRMGFGDDPLAERTASPSPGLLQKYRGRALLMVTPACAIHCRYCFRREFPYSEHGPEHLEAAIGRLAADPSITEVILSGGDPLAAPDQHLAAVLARLATLPHLRRLRIHTRTPVVLPQRITGDLLAALSDFPRPVAVVVHVNHVRELDADTRRAFAALAGTGASLLNQSVLLAGVNDTAEAQIALAETLYEQGVLPYYLHLPDAVRGTEHFQVNLSAARSLYRTICDELPGYLVPRLVQEIPGQGSKQRIEPAS